MKCFEMMWEVSMPSLVQSQGRKYVHAAYLPVVHVDIAHFDSTRFCSI